MTRGEVYWMNIYSSVEHVNDGTRPVVVVSNDACNRFSPTIHVVPLTTKPKKNMPTHVSVIVNNTKNTVLCEHIMLANRTDLKNRIGKLNDADMKLVDKAISVQLGIGGDT